MTETERIVRQFQESWDMHDPERGIEALARLCAFGGSGGFFLANPVRASYTRPV